VLRVNELRRKHGLEPLRTDERLMQVARNYSRLMAEKKFFSHYGPAGEDVADRVSAAGISFSLVAENLFKSVNGRNSVDLAVKGWMNSPGHRQNILRDNITDTGVGVWRERNTCHFTQVFIRRR